MPRSPSTFQLVVVGGTVAGAVLELAAALSRQGNLAIIIWCPALEANELRAAVKIPVTDLVERATLAPGRIFLAPRDRRVVIEDDDAVVGGVDRAPLDALFRTVADSWGNDATGVVLAGTGVDGSLGLERIKEAGGLTIAQLLEGEHAQLPNATIESGLVDFVLPLEEIAKHITSGLPLTDTAFDDTEPRRDLEARTDTLRDILSLVRVRSGNDFSLYKRATLFRRIARRMQVTGCLTLDAYHRHLREHPAELGPLMRDLLISVTNFFRDPDTFAALANDLIPKMFANKGPQDQVRVWVAGCATGEEAYTLGMLMIEHAQTLRAPPAIQIFATDIDERALVEARVGCYPDAISADLSAERLQRFFMRENNQYRVVKELRELVLFSPHNVLRDPPFSRLDLVSCRNLLIYLNRDAQVRVLSMFHFGLRPEGVLLLGSSESADTATFEVLEPKCRLFARRLAPATSLDMISTPRWTPPLATTSSYTPPERSPSLGELHYRIVENYAPPSALINADLDLVHLSEHAGRYLQIAGGEPTRQILRLAHPGLQLELRTAIYAARQHGSERRTVRFEDHGVVKAVELRVRQVDLPELGRGAMLILFDEVTDLAVPQPVPAGAVIEPIVREMEDELHRTRDHLRTTVEQYETSLEELKASNEELQAINEELRSATEELETSKEELQSVNEELTTLNHELKLKVDEVSHANSDLQNLMTSTEIGVIFLDRNLDIKRFTPRIQDVFNIIPSDLGRPLAHVTHRFGDFDLVESAQTALQSLRTIEKRIPARDGRSFLVRWLPYRSIDNRIDGVVITLIDVSDLRDAVAARERSENALEQIEERLRVALHTAPIVVFSFDLESALTWAYVMGREVPASKLRLTDLLAPHDALLLTETVRRTSVRRSAERIELAVAGYSGRMFELGVEPGANGVTVVGFDITERKQAEITLREADLRKDEFLATLSHELRNPLGPLKLALEVARVTDHDREQRAKNLTVIDNQVALLTRLVDELLDLSRITHGKLNLELAPIELADVIERATDVVRRPDAPAVHLSLPNEPMRVDGDTGRLVQVFTNLLSNAAKFTPATGRIEISAALDPRRRRAIVKVTDTGSGIASDMLPLIFELFVQSRHPDGRSRGGLGIGLNVVRRLVEMHGGSVAVASEGANKGSTFTVELPLVRH